MNQHRQYFLPFSVTAALLTCSYRAFHYRIDDFQACYFVIDSFDQLFAATRPDFTQVYQALEGRPAIEPGARLPEDRPIEI